jgi:hypothetical protein
VTIILFYGVIIYLQRSAESDLIKWDVNTATPGDFTVEFEISEKMWGLFIRNEYFQTDFTPAFAFKIYLKEKIEKIIDRRPSVLIGRSE